jgi:uncharacterized membrane protein YkgB
VAVTLPWVELVAGLLLITGVWRREAALVVALMLVVFLARPRRCSRAASTCRTAAACRSPRKPRRGLAAAWTKGVGWFLVARNLLMLAVALAIAFVRPAQAVRTR